MHVHALDNHLTQPTKMATGFRSPPCPHVVNHEYFAIWKLPKIDLNYSLEVLILAVEMSLCFIYPPVDRPCAQLCCEI